MPRFALGLACLVADDTSGKIMLHLGILDAQSLFRLLNHLAFPFFGLLIFQIGDPRRRRPGIRRHERHRCTVQVQRLAKVGAPGLVNFITSVAYHFCLACKSRATWSIDFSLSLYCNGRGSRVNRVRRGGARAQYRLQIPPTPPSPPQRRKGFRSERARANFRNN